MTRARAGVTDLAVELAPDEPFAWDARVVGDRRLRRKLGALVDRDSAGGRRISL